MRIVLAPSSTLCCAVALAFCTATAIALPIAASVPGQDLLVRRAGQDHWVPPPILTKKERKCANGAANVQANAAKSARAAVPKAPMENWDTLQEEAWHHEQMSQNLKAHIAQSPPPIQDAKLSPEQLAVSKKMTEVYEGGKNHGKEALKEYAKYHDRRSK